MADSTRLYVRARGPRVTVFGRVVRVRTRGDGGWRVRLADTGGALAAAEIWPSNPLPLPPRGARILICGRIRYNPDHAWYAIDPVDSWRDVRGDFPLPARQRPLEMVVRVRRSLARS
jgi:hypothetical protein